MIHGQSALVDDVDAEGSWRPLQNATFEYKSGLKPFILNVRLFWGDQRMGAFKIDTLYRDPKSGRMRVKKLFAGIRSWQWCALAYQNHSGPLLLVNGYWDVQTPSETSVFKLTGDKLTPFPRWQSIATLKKLESDCIAYSEKKGETCPNLIAHRVNGVWRLRQTRTVNVWAATP